MSSVTRSRKKDKEAKSNALFDMFSEWKYKKKGYQPLGNYKLSSAVQFRPEHLKRIAFVVVVIVIIMLYKWPPWSLSRYPDFPQSSTVYKSDSSLTFKNRQFFLGKRPLKIVSGAVHYFRVVPQYWSNILQKAKSCGLNTIDTYVPWNLHEGEPGKFNFAGILDLRKFLSLAKQQGLYVILRPGPYICSEWDFGGLPPWLLRDPDMSVRSTFPKYQAAVKEYFNTLVSVFSPFQYSNGGPIIAVQIENEFGAYSDRIEHLHFLKEVLVNNGVTELLLTSDGYGGHTVDPFYTEALPTANFKNYNDGQHIFDFIEKLSPDFPLLVMEFWTGWFDHWGSAHNTDRTQDMASNLKQILQRGASVSFYMFHGGTNFGFMAGANHESDYKPDITSYDYDAPLSEAGDIRPKFKVIRDLLIDYGYFTPPGREDDFDLPLDTEKTAYGIVKIEAYLRFEDMLAKVQEKQNSKHLLTMEELTIKGSTGQNHGYILYRTSTPEVKSIKLTSKPRDRLTLLINGKKEGSMDWKSTSHKINVPVAAMYPHHLNTLDLLVENLGRVNYETKDKGLNVLNNQRKGLTGEVLLDTNTAGNWTIFALEFKTEYLNRIGVYEKWRPFYSSNPFPAMLRTELHLEQRPTDTFLSMEGWGKGVVFVNRFNVGRYWNIGPQKTLYIPGPILKQGSNEILIFEENHSADSINFVDKPNLG